MLNKNLKKTPPLVISLMVFSLLIFSFPAFTNSYPGEEPSIKKNISGSEKSNPIVVYYSRSGKTRIVANALKDQLSCEVAEIKSTVERSEFWGVITCVLDSLLDRDDEMEPFNKDLKVYNPIIIAAPIWIGKLSSPARTLIQQKQSELKEKEVYVIITYSGKLTEEKEKLLKEGVTSQGIKIEGFYKVITKEKTEEEVQKEVITQLNERPILKKNAGN